MGRTKADATQRHGTDLAALSELAKSLRASRDAAMKEDEREEPVKEPKRRMTKKAPEDVVAKNDEKDETRRQKETEAKSSGSKKVENEHEKEKRDKKEKKEKKEKREKDEKKEKKEKKDKNEKKEAASKAEASSLKSALKRSKTSEKEITADELLAADGFNPCELPFTLGWENYDKLKAFYNLKDDETTTILLAMVGPSEEGRKFWSKFKVPLEMFDGNVLKVPKSAPADNSKNVADHEKFSPVDKNAANMTALPAAVSATGKKRSSLDDTSSTATTAALEQHRKRSRIHGDETTEEESTEEEPPPRRVPALRRALPEAEMVEDMEMEGVETSQIEIAKRVAVTWWITVRKFYLCMSSCLCLVFFGDDCSWSLVLVCLSSFFREEPARAPLGAHQPEHFDSILISISFFLFSVISVWLISFFLDHWMAFFKVLRNSGFGAGRS